MHQIIGSVIVGAIAGGSVGKVAWRPIVRGVIKQGIRLQRGLVDASRTVRGEVEHMVSDARAEPDHPQHSSETGAAP
jgi:hypothetical protein